MSAPHYDRKTIEQELLLVSSCELWKGNLFATINGGGGDCNTLRAPRRAQQITPVIGAACFRASLPGVVNFSITLLLSSACCVRHREVWIIEGAVATPKAVAILRAN